MRARYGWHGTTTATLALATGCLATAGCELGDGELDDFADVAYAVVDTDQWDHYDDSDTIDEPAEGSAFFGQDAHYAGRQPSYTDHGDGTVTDDRTGLMWQLDPGEKTGYDEAIAGADSFALAGYDDWRIPTIKELYSLILFSGTDPSAGADPSSMLPFIDDSVFAFEYGDEGAGERLIDSQWTTSSVYGSTVMGGQACFFGVNFADGRIKCYPTEGPGGSGYFTIHVRGGSSYGVNAFEDLGDGTVDDAATGLLWQQPDAGEAMSWQDALAHCEALSLADRGDWRLPSAKELHSIVDYDRAPDTTGSAALAPVFDATPIVNEAGDDDFGCYWSSTTHAKANGAGDQAAYVAFGRALGYMDGQWIDVHGAGAQRSDPKTGDAADYPEGHGPQGDAIRVLNQVRCVTDLDVDIDGA